jgi:hypothetical protein
LDVDVLSTVAAANAGNGNESDKPWPWFFIEPKRASDYISTDPQVKEANGSRRKKAMISCSSLFFFGGGPSALFDIVFHSCYMKHNYGLICHSQSYLLLLEKKNVSHILC